MPQSQVDFRCIGCGNAFSVPYDAIPKTGGRGRCAACGKSLAIFPDGRIFDGSLVVPPARRQPSFTPPPPPSSGTRPYSELNLASPLDAPDDPRVWELRPLSPKETFTPGPYRLADLEELLNAGNLFEGDLVRPGQGEWQPARSFPALIALFAKAEAQSRDRHGDADHCAVHKDSAAAYFCHRCKDFICRSCVLERPLIPGGPPHPFCLACEAPVDPVDHGGLGKRLKGFLKKKG